MADKELCKREWRQQMLQPTKTAIAAVQYNAASGMVRDLYPGLKCACAMIKADSSNVCTLWVDVLGSGHNGSEDAVHPLIIVVKEENGHPAYP